MYAPERIMEVPGYIVFHETLQDILANKNFPHGRLAHGLLKWIHEKGYRELERELLLGFPVEKIDHIEAGKIGYNSCIDVFFKDDKPEVYRGIWVRIQTDEQYQDSLSIKGGPFRLMVDDDCPFRKRVVIPQEVQVVLSDKYVQQLNELLGLRSPVKFAAQDLPLISQAVLFPDQRIEVHPTNMLSSALPILKEIYLQQDSNYVLK